MNKQVAVAVAGGFVAGVAGMLVMAACTVPVDPAPVTPSPSASVPYDAPGTIYEDDPQWDCRSMGNQVCGVEIKGDWYLIGFDNGEPTGSVVKQNAFHH